MSKRKSPGYWQDIDNVVAEAKGIMQKHQLSELPSQGTLIKNGYSSFVVSSNQYHGGIPKIRELLGQKNLRVAGGTWKDLDFVLAEARKIIGERGVLPSTLSLKKINGGLVDAVMTYHGGMRKFRELLGQEQLREENGTWKDLDYTLEEARKIMKIETWENLPSSNTLNDKGYSMFAKAIFRYHGGMPKFRELLGKKPFMKQVWKDLDYVLIQIREAMQKEEWDEFPSRDILREKGYLKLRSAIENHHGGIPKIRKLLGQKQKVVEMGLWKSLDYTLAQAREAMQKEGWEELPGDSTLRRKGYSSLVSATYNYHGGFSHFREILRERLTGRTEAQRLGSLLEQYASSGDEND